MAVDHKMLLATPLQLSLPSSVHPQSIRWIVDDTPLATTTPSLRLSQDVLDSTKEKHVVYAFVYTDDAGLPEFSTSWSFSFRSEETPTTRPPTKPTAQPTIPPVWHRRFRPRARSKPPTAETACATVRRPVNPVRWTAVSATPTYARPPTARWTLASVPPPTTPLSPSATRCRSRGDHLGRRTNAHDL